MPPKKSKRVPKPPRVYIDPATDVEVKAVAAKKGKGLFAKKDLPANARLVYTGKTITAAEYKKLEELNMDVANAPHKYIGYIIASGKKGQYIDANPDLKGSEDWVAGRINEPARSETANMVIAYERKPSTRPVFVTVKPIAAGQELLVHYGSGYTRVGYTAGKKVKKPSWI